MSDWSIVVVHVLFGGQCAQRRLHTTFLVELLALIFEVIKTRILLLHEACMASERDLEIKVQYFCFQLFVGPCGVYWTGADESLW